MPIRFLDPTQEAEVLPATIAKRRTFDRPVVLGLLSNTKTNALRLLQAIADDLGKHLPIERIVTRTKESASLNAADALLDELAEECDLVVTAIGD